MSSEIKDSLDQVTNYIKNNQPEDKQNDSKTNQLYDVANLVDNLQNVIFNIQNSFNNFQSIISNLNNYSTNNTKAMSNLQSDGQKYKNLIEDVLVKFPLTINT